MNIDRVLRFELSKLNLHLPERRMTLQEAISSERPRVRTKAGGFHEFDRAELEALGKLVPKEEWGKLHLPILISLDRSLGRGAAKITGRAEVRVTARVLGRKPLGEELVIYRPEIAQLRRKLPTTTQYFFRVSV